MGYQDDTIDTSLLFFHKYEKQTHKWLISSITVLLSCALQCKFGLILTSASKSITDKKLHK